MRILLDKMLRAGIKVCMLTGVAFTFAACYGPGPTPEKWEEPEFRRDQEKTERLLQAAGRQVAEQEKSADEAAH
jgi:hypothetical protein